MRRALIFLLIFVVPLFVFAGGEQEKDEAKATEEEQKVVTFWFHLDDPEARVDDLIEKFESENPNITIDAQRVPWGSYHQKLLTSVAAGDPPDVAQVKLWWQPQLVNMDALEPLDQWFNSWDGRKDIYDRVLELTEYKDGNRYLMPLQMVILYMYYRQDRFEELDLEIPETRAEFLEVAKKLTRDTNDDGKIDEYGFGIRGARGGHDWWATFVLSSGADFTPGGLTSQKAVDANQWFIDLYQEHEVSPPSTPNDGFKEVIANMESGRTAMTIHHIGSAAQLNKALGKKLSAFPVPKGTEGRWTSFGDEENAIFADSEVKDAAWKWVSFLSTAENNLEWQKASGQLSVNKSNAEADYHEGLERFVKASNESAAFASTLPALPETGEFVESLWPATMQRAFSGEIASAEMMQRFENHFFGE